MKYIYSLVLLLVVASCGQDPSAFYSESIQQAQVVPKSIAPPFAIDENEVSLVCADQEFEFLEGFESVYKCQLNVLSGTPVKLELANADLYPGLSIEKLSSSSIAGTKFDEPASTSGSDPDQVKSNKNVTQSIGYAIRWKPSFNVASYKIGDDIKRGQVKLKVFSEKGFIEEYNKKFYVRNVKRALDVSEIKQENPLVELQGQSIKENVIEIFVNDADFNPVRPSFPKLEISFASLDDEEPNKCAELPKYEVLGNPEYISDKTDPNYKKINYKVRYDLDAVELTHLYSDSCEMSVVATAVNERVSSAKIHNLQIQTSQNIPNLSFDSEKPIEIVQGQDFKFSFFVTPRVKEDVGIYAEIEGCNRLFNPKTATRNTNGRRPRTRGLTLPADNFVCRCDPFEAPTENFKHERLGKHTGSLICSISTKEIIPITRSKKTETLKITLGQKLSKTKWGAPELDVNKTVTVDVELVPPVIDLAGQPKSILKPNQPVKLSTGKDITEYRFNFPKFSFVDFRTPNDSDLKCVYDDTDSVDDRFECFCKHLPHPNNSTICEIRSEDVNSEINREIRISGEVQVGLNRKAFNIKHPLVVTSPPGFVAEPKWVAASQFQVVPGQLTVYSASVSTATAGASLNFDLNQCSALTAKYNGKCVCVLSTSDPSKAKCQVTMNLPAAEDIDLFNKSNLSFMLSAFAEKSNNRSGRSIIDIPVTAEELF